MIGPSNNANDSSRPRKLGRGLSSLIEIRSPVQVVATTPAQSSHPDEVAPHDQARQDLTAIHVDQIVANKHQPRKGFDESALAHLAESIKHSGMMQPVIVRRAEKGGGYELVAGERRWRAARLAGLTEIPALVRDLSDEESAEWAIVENVQREDLNPIERAWAFKSLMDRFGLSHGQIAERAGLERSSVTNFVRLTELEAQIQEMISAGKLNYGHGRALLAVGAGEGRVDLATEAVREGWSVRRLERAAANIAKAKAATPAGSPHVKSTSVEDLERRLGEYLGTQVSIQTDRGGKRGKIVVGFYGLDHFDGLMSRIGFVRS